MLSRFALRNYAGEPVAYYRVEAAVFNTSETTSQAASHHIIVIDVSGSMYYDLNSLKPMVEKLLTLEEFADPSLKLSLVTYSSKGDVRVHFERATVADVMAPNSPQLAEIRNLQVRGLTCISQGLNAAAALVGEETTCISLHSDGYANDRSPSSEKRDIAAAVEELKKRKNVFCNALAYGSWADFNTLSSISNSLSGACIQAKDIRQVYEAMHEATGLLAGDMSPAVEVPIGSAECAVFVSKKDRKVLGGTESLAVRGLSSGSDATAYYFYPMLDVEYAASTLPEVHAGYVDGEAILAYARVQVALGNLNTAKYALVAYKDAALLGAHYRALTGSDVAAMSAAMEDMLFSKRTPDNISKTYGLPSMGPSVLEVLGILETYRSGIRLNVDKLSQGYTRRGLKRVAGTRNSDGTITPPAARLATPSDRTSVPVSGIEINRNTATVNIRVVQDGMLVNADKKVVSEVAGVPLNLKDYRNFTIIGDGTLNVSSLHIRISDKRCFKALAELKVLKADVLSSGFDPETEYEISFSDLPLVDVSMSIQRHKDVFKELAGLTVLQKILSGITAGSSTSLTGEQIAALKALHITPALYFSPPSTTAYENLQDALAVGTVDSRVSYKVEIGSPQITNLGKLKSGNAYFERRYVLRDADGKEVKKPKLPMLLDSGTTVALKTLSSRTKLDAVDDLSFPIYQEFLGMAANGHLLKVMVAAGIEYTERLDFVEAMQGEDRELKVEILTKMLAQVNAAIDTLYHTEISPLVFYIGATGLIPDSLNARSFTSDQLVERFPEVNLSKAEKEEGTFFLVSPNLLITVYSKNEYFTTDAGLKA